MADGWKGWGGKSEHLACHESPKNQEYREGAVETDRNLLFHAGNVKTRETPIGNGHGLRSGRAVFRLGHGH